MSKDFTIPLWSTPKPSLDPADDFQPSISCHLLEDGAEHGAIIVFPGGGYHCKMLTYEGEDVALRFNELGFHSFVVDYRCGLNRFPFPAPVEDALRAIKLVRGNANTWKVNPAKIATTGFSAGGHLCCATAVLFDKVSADNGDGFDSVSARPDAILPAYAVVSPFAGEEPHVGSFYSLLGKENPSEAELHEFALDEHIRPDSPPAFIWHTVGDQTVPCENSLSLAMAYRKAGVPFELHLYPYGHHGLGLGTSEDFPEVRSWPELAAMFLR